MLSNSTFRKLQPKQVPALLMGFNPNISSFSKMVTSAVLLWDIRMEATVMWFPSAAADTG